MMATPGVARLAVAGLGRMGRLHAENLARRCRCAELAAVFDLRGDLAQKVSEELGTRAAASYEELLDDPSIDAVVIASPTCAHAEMALAAGRAGKPVFCEKPLSLERDATVEIVGELSRAGVPLQVGFHRRFDPALSAAAARLRAGELGEVLLFRASQRDMAPPAPEFLAGSGGIFIDMGVHDFDTARWLVGEVESVSAHGSAWADPAFAASDPYHTVVVVLHFASGALGAIDVSRVAGYGYESSLELMGEKATVRVQDPFSVGYEWRVAGSASRPLVETFGQRYQAAFAEELEHFARTVRAGVEAEPSGLDALAAFDIAGAAAEACRTGMPVAVRRPVVPDQ